MKKSILSILYLLLSFAVFAQCEYPANLGNDTSICENESILIDAYTPYALYYLWQDGSTESFYIAYDEGIYSCEILEYGDNLIENGDFELGDTLFSSEYELGTGGTWGLLSYEGTYAINTDPLNTHTNFASCSDHTSGIGNMMVVNGSDDANEVIWSQTVQVLANTNYQFSTWLMSVVAPNPAQLQFSINGINFGETFSPGSTTCDWQQFAEVWNSENNTTAVISIVNQNTQVSGNDFAIDDVIFYELCQSSDSMELSITPTPIVNLGMDTVICTGDILTLDVQTQNASYLWQDGSINSYYNVDQLGFYWAEVTVETCKNSDSIFVATDDCNVSLLFPNVFTPNGDGKNDIFKPVNSLGVLSIHTMIFNRWGMKIFESDDPNVLWRAKDVNEGTYFWMVDYHGIDGNNYSQNGTIAVLR